uniref:Phage MuF C-terminal domain-containing protein n=1 Tax=uncultured bacterium URE12 TaxID=581111 RepID=C0JZS0_9BACT|nr:hypothetical protein MELB17_24182 [uncultured bacterium URE12]
MAQAADVVGNKIPQILEHELDDATLEGQADEIAAEFRKTVENLGKDRPLSAQFRAELDGIEQKAKEYAEAQGINGKRAELYGLLYRQQVSMWHSITGMSPEYIAERFPVVLQNYNSGANETAEGTAAGKSQEAGTEESQVGRTLNQPPYNETGSFGKTIKQFFGVSGRTDAEIYADIHGKIRNPKVANNTRISLGYVPDIYVALGLIKDKDLKASKLTFRKAYGLITQAELIANKDLHNHNVPDDVIKKIGSLIADPLLIMDSKKHPGRIMAVVQDFVVDKKTNAVIPPIVIIISPSKRGHGYSFVPTAYDKNNLINLISWADSKKKIYYISDKKIALNRIAYGNKSQLPSMLHGLSQSTLLSNSIPSKEDIVKRFGLTGNNGTSLYQTAYAGSRTDYDRPALEAIGTGEGNQVHGWGLYYALNRGVAEGYRKRFTDYTVYFRGKQLINNEPENPGSDYWVCVEVKQRGFQGAKDYYKEAIEICETSLKKFPGEEYVLKDLSHYKEGLKKIESLTAEDIKELTRQNGLNDTQAEYMGRWQRTRMQVYSMYTGMSPKYLSEQMRIGLSNKGKPIREFYERLVKMHSHLVEKTPSDWNGQTREDVKKEINFDEGKGYSEINSPIETVKIKDGNITHLIKENDTERKKKLLRTLRTIQNPNIIVEAPGHKDYNRDKTYHYYIKLFNVDGKTTSHWQIVKIAPDGNFYTTNFGSDKKQIDETMERGKTIYDLSSLPGIALNDSQAVYRTESQALPTSDSIAEPAETVNAAGIETAERKTAMRLTLFLRG